VCGFSARSAEKTHTVRRKYSYAEGKNADRVRHDKGHGRAAERRWLPKPHQLMAHCLHSDTLIAREVGMQQLKQTWLAVGRMGRWTLGFCVSARCLRNTLRRQRMALRQMNTASSYSFTTRTI
jgi:hypothetical protein